MRGGQGEQEPQSQNGHARRLEHQGAAGVQCDPRRAAGGRQQASAACQP